VTPSGAGPPEGAVVQYLLAWRDRERQQLAADIHDGPQQTTTALRLLADGARHALEHGDIDQARGALGRIEQLAKEASDQLRRVSAMLDPVVLERRGALQALSSLPDLLSREHAVEARFSGTTELPSDATRDVVVYAIAREFSLEAIDRGATRIGIELAEAPGGMQLRVDAHGCTAPVPEALQVLSQRAAGIGASLSVDGRDPVRLLLNVPGR
jgi:signal transduction histidine kinase